MTAGAASASRRSRGGAALAWLQQEGGGDAGTLSRESLQALVAPPRDSEQESQVPCGHIDRSPYQARRVFPAAAMAELKESVRQNGLLQPVVVRPRPGGRFELVAGERRWCVVQLLGWEMIPAVVRVVDDITAHLLGQIENDTREDVSAWERALGYVDLRDHVEREHGATPSLAELGEMHGGVDKSTVSRYLTIGDAFTPEAAARAGISEEEMATLSLPTLLRAARKPEAQGFALLRDVLRKRRARAAARAGRARAARSEGPDARPAAESPRPTDADLGPADGPRSAAGWERYYRESAIRVETQVPARELTPKQARAAAARMVPALAALSARAGGTDQPAPLVLEGPGGKLIFLPERMEGAPAAAYEDLQAALGL